MTALLHRIPWEVPATLAGVAILLALLPRIVRSAWNALGGRKRKASDWTRGQRLLACALTALGTGITIPAFTEIYLTVTHLVHPAFGAWSWTVPVSGEIAFTYLFLNGVLLAMRRAPAGALRSVLIAAIIAGSVVLNIWAYLGSVPAVVGHLIIVAAFFGVLLAGKETVMTLRGGKVRADRITAGEWIAQPARSAALWRWMKTWGEPSRDAALERYMHLLYARAVAQADPRIGRRPFTWRRNLPLPLRYQLATGLLPLVTADGADWQEATEVHVRKQLALLPEPVSGEPEPVVPDEPETLPEDEPEVHPRPRPKPRPELPSGPALKLSASKSRNMTPGELEPHVAAMLEKYGDVSQARVKRDLSVGTEKATEALRMAKKNRTVVPISQRAGG